MNVSNHSFSVKQPKFTCTFVTMEAENMLPFVTHGYSVGVAVSHKLGLSYLHKILWRRSVILTQYFFFLQVKTFEKAKLIQRSNICKITIFRLAFSSLLLANLNHYLVFCHFESQQINGPLVLKSPSAISVLHGYSKFLC